MESFFRRKKNQKGSPQISTKGGAHVLTGTLVAMTSSDNVVQKETAL